ncbi:MAG: LysR family transcriptional regulator [Cyanobacteria bacterium J06554_1]
MDQFAAMRALVKVVETGSFSEASRQLNLAVSSVTRQINSLERSLNTQLLNRSTRSVTVTPRGRQYYEKVARILQDVAEANACAREGSDTPRGVLRVGMPVAFGRLQVAPLLHGFLTQCPEIRLELRLSDGLANFVEDELDMVIRIGNLDRSSDTLLVRKLADYTRLVCGSPSYFARHPQPGHPNELTEHNCLIFEYSSGHSVWRFQQGPKTYEITVRGSVIANNSDVLRQICLDGTGLMLMPTWLVDEDIRTGKLQAVLTDFDIHPQAGMDMGIYVLYPPSRRHSPRVRAMLDFLVDHFRPHATP